MNWTPSLRRPETLSEHLRRLADQLVDLAAEIRSSVAGLTGEAIGQAVRDILLRFRKNPAVPASHWNEGAEGADQALLSDAAILCGRLVSAGPRGARTVAIRRVRWMGLFFAILLAGALPGSAMASGSPAVAPAAVTPAASVSPALATAAATAEVVPLVVEFGVVRAPAVADDTGQLVATGASSIFSSLLSAAARIGSSR